MMTRLGRGCRQIVSIYGASFKQPNMALVYQYIPGGSLYERIHKSDKPPLTYLEVTTVPCSSCPAECAVSACCICGLIYLPSLS